MRHLVASRIMPRTTLNLDAPVLADLQRLQRKEGKALGDLASELLAAAIASRKTSSPKTVRLRWTSQAMGALVDLDDKEALFAALDAENSENRELRGRS